MYTLTISKTSIRRSFKDGSFFMYDGRGLLITGYNLQTRTYTVQPGDRVRINRLKCQVMIRPVLDLDKTAWDLGLYKGERVSNLETFRAMSLQETFIDERRGVERPAWRTKYGQDCAVATLQVPGLDFGRVMCWYADPDCDERELIRLMK